MNQQLPVIIVIVPLILSIVNSFTRRRNENVTFYYALAAMSVCLVCSIIILNTVNSQGTIQYHLGGWPPPIGIEYRVDHLNAFMLILISFIGFITAIHAKKSVEKELPGKIALFWCLFLLLITGLLGIAITGDLFNLFVFLEVTSLTGYALVAVGNKKATVAGFRYLILGSIGACFYLLGVGYLYIATGTLNIADLAQLLPRLYESKTILMGVAFILIGLSMKTALFPMHIWLPDAYTYAPSAVSAVVAPLMTKVMAYVMIRIIFTVLQPAFSITVLRVTDIMVWMGTFAVLFGAVMALPQKDFKRMLSYIIVAEIGYIIGGIGVANTIALKGAIFHILNDAMMMSCLFLTAGQVMYRKGGQSIDDFKGIFKTMPVTAAVFTVGALAVIGVPPTCGFFSKWYLLLGGIQANQWGFVAALLICTLINIALFFRIFDKGIFIHTHGSHEHTIPSCNSNAGHGEAPLIMLVPAILVAFVIILIGVFNQFIINEVLCFTFFP
ncbi:MAG: monovalent cation/H+ antiporter subunit D family protein [Desulfobacteraceae bacterium]|nr:monovalent cation/H+ antiporter subunit D family protein [Desulfobacteraceae bacterium]